MNILRECNCDEHGGWKKFIYTNPINNTIINSSFFNSIMMSLLIPIQSRTILIDKISKFFNINIKNLYPCYDNNTLYVKINILKLLCLYDIDNKYNMNISKYLEIIFKILLHHDKSITTQYNKIDNFLPIFTNKKKYYTVNNQILFSNENVIPFNIEIDEDNNIIAFDIYNNIHNEIYTKILIIYKKFKLISICIETDSSDAISIISCNNKWFLYDDNVASENKPLIKLKTNLIDNFITFDTININKFKHYILIYVKV